MEELKGTTVEEIWPEKIMACKRELKLHIQRCLTNGVQAIVLSIGKACMEKLVVPIVGNVKNISIAYKYSAKR